MQVLVNAHLYPECQNHMRLQEHWRKHVNNQPETTIRIENFTAGWYRIDGQAGKRLLDITDIPNSVFKKNLVRLILLSTYVNNLLMLYCTILPYFQLTTNKKYSDKLNYI